MNSENGLNIAKEENRALNSPLGKSWGLTRNIPFPNIYVKMLPEYSGWIFLEEEAMTLSGQWRSVFPQSHLPLDLEIGSGNGFFFAQQAEREPGRNLLALELKYKPLVQTVRRVKKVNRENGRGIRFHARYIDRIFKKGELDNIFIYFPDPWPKKRQQKNRLLRTDFFTTLAGLQKPGGIVNFKTDSLDYFRFVEKELRQVSGYKIDRHSLDLHHSPWAAENFMTSFERIFTNKGQPIYYMRLTNTTL